MTLPPLTIDGASELLRCPDLRTGWDPGSLVVEHVDSIWNLPPRYASRIAEWDRRHPGERSDPKVALRSFRVGSDGIVRCRLQPTTWRVVRALHEGPALRREDVMACDAGGCDLLLPNIGVVHVVATTTDRWVLSFRRSDASHYHPGRRSVTYEEGLAPEDLADGDVFRNTALRGLLEELGSQDIAIPNDAFRVLSVVLELPLGNPAIVVAASLPMTLDELTTRMASDELDVASLVPIRVEKEALIEAIMGTRRGAVSIPTPWHPTARYRLLLALAHELGEAAAAEVWARISSAPEFHSVKDREP